MDAIITEYQRWKQQGTTIRNQAKQAMEARFRDLLNEAAEIAQEYHSDFGAALKPPASITAFKYKAGQKVSPKKAAAKSAPALPSPSAPSAPVSAKLTALNKKLDAAKKKLDAAKAAGTSTRNLEDKLYEIEDEIRLAASA